MLSRIGTHRWWLALVIVPLALAAQSCVSAPTDEELPADGPPRPTLNHGKHLAKNMECIDCHDPDERGELKLPAVGLCWDCHDEDESTWNEAFRAYFEAIRKEDGTFAFQPLAYSDDLIFDHAEHAAAEVGCADCHGEPSEKAFVRPPLMELKDRCMSCHEEKGASNSCEVCHETIRSEVAPASHDGAFLEGHGAEAPDGWKRGEGGLCALCHAVPSSCDSCHKETKPPSHTHTGFRELHGRDIVEQPFDTTSCSLCHEQTSCVACHQVEKPRNHTRPFERRLHGVVASVERMSCMTCHRQDFCDRCHRTSRPVSHVGSWGNGRQVHCIGCHDPLPMNGCYACHKNTLGHLQATPLPPGPPHNAARDCRTCHPVISHLDDGGNCRRCHR